MRLQVDKPPPPLYMYHEDDEDDYGLPPPPDEDPPALPEDVDAQMQNPLARKEDSQLGGERVYTKVELKAIERQKKQQVKLQAGQVRVYTCTLCTLLFVHCSNMFVGLKLMNLIGQEGRTQRQGSCETGSEASQTGREGCEEGQCRRTGRYIRHGRRRDGRVAWGAADV